MWKDLLQRQRFEQKYIITESQALKAREYIRCFLIPDPYASKNGENRAYEIHSIYLDSPDLLTYWAWVCCEKKRFKLRIRYYDKANPIVFLEIKRRENNCIFKSRAPIHRENLAAVINLGIADPGLLVDQSPDLIRALNSFVRLAQGLNASPILHVWYSREAWMSPYGNSLRITFDRFVSAELVSDFNLRGPATRAASPYGNQIIMEIKFTEQYPKWVADLIHDFNFVSCGAANYCRSIEALYGDTSLSQAPLDLQVRLEQLLQYT